MYEASRNNVHPDMIYFSELTSCDWWSHSKHSKEVIIFEKAHFSRVYFSGQQSLKHILSGSVWHCSRVPIECDSGQHPNACRRLHWRLELASSAAFRYSAWNCESSPCMIHHHASNSLPPPTRGWCGSTFLCQNDNDIERLATSEDCRYLSVVEPAKLAAVRLSD